MRADRIRLRGLVPCAPLYLGNLQICDRRRISLDSGANNGQPMIGEATTACATRFVLTINRFIGQRYIWHSRFRVA